MPRGPRGLTRAAVLGAALDIIDEKGVSACTMRAVGARLGVEAMSLYWHVPGKQALHDGVVERILGEAPEEPEPFDEWTEWMVLLGFALRARLLSHPRAFPLLVERSTSIYSTAGPLVDSALASLERAGVARDSAGGVVRTLVRFVVGSVLMEVGLQSTPPPLPADATPRLRTLLRSVYANGESQEELFRFGLEALIGGFGSTLTTV